MKREAAVTLSHGWKRFAALAACVLAFGLAGAGGAQAAGPGPDVCANCHKDQVDSYAHSIHGQKANVRGPAATGECSSCHGDATEHVKAGGGRGVGIRNP